MARAAEVIEAAAEGVEVISSKETTMKCRFTMPPLHVIERRSTRTNEGRSL